MPVATRTLKDTILSTGGGAQGGLVTVMATMNDNTTADTLILDASGLAGHANGAKLSINRAWWALIQGTTDDNTGWVGIEFKGASADTVAINFAGTGHYDGTAGKIENNATNTTATSGDIELSAYGVSGYVILELRKESGFTA